MTYNYEVFTDYTDYKGTVTIADGTTLEARGNGTIKIEVNGRPTIITDVVYVPKLGYNLILSWGLTAGRLGCGGRRKRWWHTCHGS
jgi:hypothetical protein